MACAVERVSLYCGDSTAGRELRSDLSSPEESSSSSSSSTGESTSGGSVASSGGGGPGTRNKRKCGSPRRRDAKKGRSSPFRPWNPQSEEPLPLLVDNGATAEDTVPDPRPASEDGESLNHRHSDDRTSCRPDEERPGNNDYPSERPCLREDVRGSCGSDGGLSPRQEISSPVPISRPPPPPHLPPPPPPPSRCGGVRGQRNYKNMTRERRMEANARERSRVHTISAAFETLRRAVPAYSHNQKLSKLSVLRVAASYILTLSRVVGKDYSHDQSSPSIAECVENVSNTIQMEGKLRKRKEE